MNIRRSAAVLFFLMLSVLGASPALRAQAVDLAPEDQARLAERFAPVLVFHAAEKFFPTNPLFQIEQPAGAAEGSPVARLGTPETRTEEYEELPLESKARIATVYYRAYPARSAGNPVVVVEYWFYYVRNEYRVRGNVLPFWMSGSHPNDLEHVHIVLRRNSGKYVVDEVFASAHEGRIPANRYRYGAAGHEGPTRFLVELGSHALAPDINDDGIFTPGTDGDSGSKVLWGVRDRGLTWPRFRIGYMQGRSNGNAIVFVHEGTRFQSLVSAAQGRELSYRLVAVDSLIERLDRLHLTNSQRKHAFESQMFWFKRVFGGDNGRSKELLVPSSPSSGGKSVGVLGVSSSERRFLLGTVLNVDQPGLFAGGRYSFLTASPYLPDLMFEMDGIVTRRKNYLSPQALLSYPVDGFSKIMVGRALITDSLKFNRRQWDWIGMIEFRLGDMRISAATRSVGPLRAPAKEFRLFYSFQ